MRARHWAHDLADEVVAALDAEQARVVLAYLERLGAAGRLFADDWLRDVLEESVYTSPEV